MFGILANTLNADPGMLPGLAIIGPGLGFPVSALTAFLERPSYTRAGVRCQTIWYSLQANFVSHLLGIPLLFCAFGLANALGQSQSPFIFWPFLAVGCSIVIEGRYLRRRITPEVFRWRWAIAGNMFSALVSVALITGIVWVRERYPSQVRAFIPAQMPLYFGSLVGSSGLFFVSFAMTRQTKRSEQAVSNIGMMDTAEQAAGKS